MTIEELLAENKRLKEENNRLKGLLRKNNIDYTFEKEKTLTMDDKIKIYLSYSATAILSINIQYW